MPLTLPLQQCSPEIAPRDCCAKLCCYTHTRAERYCVARHRFSTTQWQTGATGIDACSCIVGYYRQLPGVAETASQAASTSASDGASTSAPLSPSTGAETFDCRRCNVGTNCTVEGLATSTLPLLPGYWRASPRSPSAYRCPDATSGNSGCIGGTHTLCKPTLTGELGWPPPH